MLIFPAIDIRDGRVVRLRRGDYDDMTVYDLDPAEVARSFYDKGATCMHVVDLDGAKDGSPKNRDVIAELCKTPLFLEVGGGIRSEQTIIDTLALGAGRVILGTVAVEDFEFTQRMGRIYGERLAVGVDARDGFVATRGWRNSTDIRGIDFCKRLVSAGITTVIYTDIGRDGLLGGSNLAVYEELKHIDGLNVIASGGVSGLGEIARLRDIGVYGAIIGKALYQGTMTLESVLSIARGEQPC